MASVPIGALAETWFITNNNSIGKLQVGIFQEGRAFWPKMSLKDIWYYMPCLTSKTLWTIPLYLLTWNPYGMRKKDYI